MEHDFTYSHYREILGNALKAGYQISSFHNPVPINEHSSKRILYIRHDVDGTLTKAVKLARIETEMEVRATYFVLANSPLYNLLEESSLSLIQELSSLGHWIGLHVDLTMISDVTAASVDELVEKLFAAFGQLIPLTRVVSFHRPAPEVLDKKFPSFTSTYEPRFFSQIKYLSDSRRIWREGCPCTPLREGRYNQLQLLVHPIWWGDESDLSLLATSVIKERIKELKSYLATNISPFKDALYGKENR